MIHTLLSASLLMLAVLLLGLSIKSARHDRYWPMVLFLFCVGVQLLQALLSMGTFYERHPNWLHAGTWLLFANGPTMWLMLHPKQPNWSQVRWHGVPALLAFVWLLTFYHLDPALKSAAYYGRGAHKMWFWLLFLLHWFGYWLLIWRRFGMQPQPNRSLMWLVLGLSGSYLLSSGITWLGLFVGQRYWAFWDLLSLVSLALLVAGITLLHVTRTGHLIQAQRPAPPIDFTAPLQRLVREQKIHREATLDLPGLAQALGCSARLLSAWFNQPPNSGFHHWLNTQRVADAQQQICNRPEAQVSTIGYDVGYNSSATFYRAFKQITGQSPGVFKKQAP
ncbi:helix-turn-helix domain-containing protein [Marinicella meishanensis]|uniref:helix-turn-helix domain-containing protein n=1 Tax=Marinicella meishanensis TaxID=2873263 RepID=UPI001CC13FEC|nr:helix-turn-helix transcriptional regulator [Marinicella sp. NBU2979]